MNDISGFKSHDFYGVLFSYQGIDCVCEIQKISQVVLVR